MEKEIKHAIVTIQFDKDKNISACEVSYSVGETTTPDMVKASSIGKTGEFIGSDTLDKIMDNIISCIGVVENIQ